jgi:precorrin-3B C17-methyltransferase
MLSIVGIGPGNAANMTAACLAALKNANVLVGYTKYIELVLSVVPQKRIVQTGMTREIQRAQLALSLAEAGENVAVVCSGDAGVYGMAGLIYEMSVNYPNTDIEVVPGVTAALSGAALLGSPLGHDFCVISLSDLLTPWELIEKRLSCASKSDFCIAIYNPSSKKRFGYLKRACGIMLKTKSVDTVCGIAKNIGRRNAHTHIMTLGELQKYQADMFTVIFIGNSQTKVVRGNMVTPRGYCIG